MVIRSLPKSSYRCPHHAAMLVPYGSRGSIESTRISSVSPGTAPSTWIGPVMTCTPGPRVAIGMASYTARTPSSIMRSGASPA